MNAEEFDKLKDKVRERWVTSQPDFQSLKAKLDAAIRARPDAWEATYKDPLEYLDGIRKAGQVIAALRKELREATRKLEDEFYARTRELNLNDFDPDCIE